MKIFLPRLLQTVQNGEFLGTSNQLICYNGNVTLQNVDVVLLCTHERKIGSGQNTGCVSNVIQNVIQYNTKHIIHSVNKLLFPIIA